jgi:DNA polymerase-4
MNNNLRHILHMDLDTFFVSCERLLDSRLVGRPVLVGGTSDRGVVAACSYEARQFGIHSAMPMRMAKQLCPEAVVVRGNSATYSKLSRTVTEIIQEEVPLFEKTSIDEFYIDLTGMDRFFGCQKIATGQAKPNNQRYVDHGHEKPFLAPLSVAKIPMVGKVTYKQLCDLGIKRIATLQEMPVEFLVNVFGKNGQQIWHKANGIDKSPVVPYTERQSISTERTFNRDTTDHQKLRSILIAMAENLAFQLRRGHKLTGCVAVKIRYSDFQTYTQQQKIAYSAADHNIIPTVVALYEKLYQRRMLVRLIGVRLSDLVSGGHQIDLFNDAEKTIKLYQAMDLMRERYGDRSVMRAVGMEARTIGRTNPFDGEPPALLANRRQ